MLQIILENYLRYIPLDNFGHGLNPALFYWMLVCCVILFKKKQYKLTTEVIAEVIRSRDKARIIPIGIMAMNASELSSQVLMNYEYGL